VNAAARLQGLRTLVREHKLFSAALAVGAFLRLLTMLGYPGALWFAGDSYVYLGAALRPQPNLSKSTGYSFFLRLLLPFHSLTLVTLLQHLMGLAVAVMIYVLLRRNGVSKIWSTAATLPVLLDGYMIEDEHLIMAEALFTFLLMAAMLLLLWRRDIRWWSALVAGLLVGYAVDVRTEGAIVLLVFPLFVLGRGLLNHGWKNLRGWLAAVLMAIGCLIPVGAYMGWFHHRTGHYGVSMATGFYLWGRVSSFANCAVIKPTGKEAIVCPAQPLSERTPPGNWIWHAPPFHSGVNPIGSPVSAANNQLLTDFAIRAVEAQPLDYVKTVVKNTMLSFGFPRIAYPGGGTVYYYDFHLHYKTAKVNLLPPNNPDHEWIPGGTAYQDWLSYGHQAPGRVIEVFAIPILLYQRLVFTYGPLLALIFLVGLGGVIGVRHKGWRRPREIRLRWEPRGTTMLPWVTAVALLVFPIAIADFDYRYLLPVIPFACVAAGLAFAPRRDGRRGGGGEQSAVPAEEIDSGAPVR
jgi:Dolichyl-phosphate-mannose-protein mannosyltransferase